jgi:hypothetical protein
MSRPFVLAAAAATTVAALSLAAAPAAEAGHRHRHGGMSIAIGTSTFFGIHGPFYGQNYRPAGVFRAGGVYHMPYGYRGEPFCRQWAWVYTRSGKQKWRCIAW